MSQIFYLQLDDIQQLQAPEQLNITSSFHQDLTQLLQLKKIRLVQSRFRTHSHQLQHLIFQPLQQEMHQSVINLMLISKFKFIFKQGRIPQRLKYQEKIKQLYVKIFVSVKQDRHIIMNIIVMIHGFMAYRKFYQIFKSKRNSFISNSMKIEICQELNLIVLGLAVSPLFVSLTMDRIFGKVQLICKREQKQQEQKRKKQRQAALQKKRKFLMTQLKPVQCKSQQQRSFTNTISQLLTKRDLAPLKITKREEDNKLIENIMLKDKRLDLASISTSMKQFLGYQKPLLKFCKSSTTTHNYTFNQKFIFVRDQKKNQKAQPLDKQINANMDRKQYQSWAQQLNKLKSNHIQNLFQKKQKEEFIEYGQIQEKEKEIQQEVRTSSHVTDKWRKSNQKLSVSKNQIRTLNRLFQKKNQIVQAFALQFLPNSYCDQKSLPFISKPIKKLRKNFFINVRQHKSLKGMQECLAGMRWQQA